MARNRINNQWPAPGIPDLTPLLAGDPYFSDPQLEAAADLPEAEEDTSEYEEDPSEDEGDPSEDEEEVQADTNEDEEEVQVENNKDGEHMEEDPSEDEEDPSEDEDEVQVDNNEDEEEVRVENNEDEEEVQVENNEDGEHMEEDEVEEHQPYGEDREFDEDENDMFGFDHYLPEENDREGDISDGENAPPPPPPVQAPPQDEFEDRIARLEGEGRAYTEAIQDLFRQVEAIRAIADIQSERIRELEASHHVLRRQRNAAEYRARRAQRRIEDLEEEMGEAWERYNAMVDHVNARRGP